MRLTKFSDYALRVLLLAAAANGRSLTIEETANAYGISRAHLKKVVLLLARTGYLNGIRGRSGGFTLVRAPDQISLGAVLRVTEPDFALVECFSVENTCRITCQCRLPQVLNKALNAFLAVLDEHTLQDVLADPGAFTAMLGDLPQPLPQYQPQPQRGPKLAAAAQAAIRGTSPSSMPRHRDN
jgi:Rrf2 family nitric oxide-sensitive transcriptional repressor